ncbi:MAG: alpha-mannosidase [Chthonomonadales bacterium]|nr:alpha-mannosidase [Chthonomonadales bacterium]
MSSNAVHNGLARLRRAADRAHHAFPEIEWTRVSGPGPETLKQDGAGGFHGLTLAPAQDLTLECSLFVPDRIVGVPVGGDELEATLFTLYPVEIEWNGQPAYRVEGVPVAAGPCLFTVIPSLMPGSNGTLRMTLRIPDNQTTPWFQLTFTTAALRARFEALDIAWSQLYYASAIAMTPDERKIVEEAAAAVPEALPEDESALIPLLNQLSAALSPLETRAKAMTVHCIGHSHIDLNWLWTWPDTVEVIKRDFRSVLALMEEFPELMFSHSQPASYDVVRKEEPDLFERVLQRIREGRWEPISMTWVEGDVNMASGEAHARQLLEGCAYTRDVLGYRPSTFHAPDTFGHAGNLPQLAVSAGAQRYYHHRANPGGPDAWPAYWWEGQDGTRILAFSTPSYNGDIHASDLARAVVRAFHAGHPCAVHFHGIGDHGGGPSRQNLEALRRFQGTPLLPAARCSTTEAYTRELLASGVALPVHRGESSTIFEGCYTTHADTKRYNRHGENLLTTAEALMAMSGHGAMDEVREAWRAVCFNQFHDIFDGSAIHEVYNRNREDYEAVRATAEKISGTALEALISPASPGDIVVVNPLGLHREDWVIAADLNGEGSITLADAQGRTVPAQYVDGGLGFIAEVPAYETAVYRILEPAAAPEADLTPEPAYAPADGRQADTPEAAAAAPYLRIDTHHYLAYLRRDCGVLVGFYDKRAHRELVGFGMRRPSDYMDTARPDLGLNVFQITEELPHAMTAWEVQELSAVHNLITGAQTRIVETGPVRCVIEVERAVRKSRIVQRIIFYRRLARIDFETTVEWNELGDPQTGVPGLKVAFTGRMPECEAWYETPFAAVQRPSDGQEVPALRWADVGGPTYGFALLNDCKYGYDAMGCRLRLTLIRSAYDPDAISDIGTHVFRYAFVPHPGDWRDASIPAQAAGFNQPLIARSGAQSRLPRAAPRLSNPQSAMITCLKPAAADRRHIVIRVNETAGRHVAHARLWLPGVRAAWTASIIEEPQGQVVIDGDAVDLSLRPWEVRTYLAELRSDA